MILIQTGAGQAKQAEKSFGNDKIVLDRFGYTKSSILGHFIETTYCYRVCLRFRLTKRYDYF